MEPESVITVRRRPRVRRVLRVATVAGGLGLLLYVLSATAVFGGRQVIFDEWAFAAVYVVAGGVTALRAALVPAERGAWLAFAFALIAQAGGWVAYWVFVRGVAHPAYPSLADALWLSGYALEYLGLVLLVRARATRFNRSLLLDGAIGVLALAAISEAVVIPQIIGSTGGSLTTVLVALAYPFGDLIVMATVVTVFALMGWRPSRSWVALGLAGALQAVADSAYVYGAAAGTWEQGTLADAAWPLGALLFAAAAWSSAEHRRSFALEGWRMLAAPGTFTLVAIGVLVYGSVAHIATAAVVLATATLVAAAARTVAAFRGMLLLAESHEQALDAALRDHLTGLFNHRAFHESLDAALAAGRREGLPVSLLMVDLVGLKETNDNLGHQAGDERLKHLAVQLSGLLRSEDSAYRVGGDEFAVVLPGVQAWNGYGVGSRLQLAFSGDAWGSAPAVSIGVAEAEPGLSKDELIGRADAALREAKRSHRKTVLYSIGLELQREALEAGLPHVHTKALATALARAVDAKDSYTRSHCETVAELCVTIAGNLGLEAGRIEQLRLAGLLHDVGKIGVPDSILQKPSRLTDAEFETMKTHSRLGHSIVSGAGLAEEARWILHHHERPDGRGYPEGLSGDAIPFESRIILVADAFEAMTSDRPYREAERASVALEELNRHSGTQFDPECVAALERALVSRRAASVA